MPASGNKKRVRVETASSDAEPDTKSAKSSENEAYELMDKLTNGKTRVHVPVRVRKARQERDMRSTQRMMRDIKRKNTLKRASKPRTKQTRQSGPKKVPSNGYADAKLKLPPIETEHERLMKEFQGTAQQMVYQKNYHDFLLRRGVATNDAKAADEKEEADRQAQEQAHKRYTNYQKHKNKLTPALVAIATQVPHASGTKIDQEPPRPRGSNDLFQFFQSKVGHHTSVAEREWRKCYRRLTRRKARSSRGTCDARAATPTSWSMQRRRTSSVHSVGSQPMEGKACNTKPPSQNNNRRSVVPHRTTDWHMYVYLAVSSF